MADNIKFKLEVNNRVRNALITALDTARKEATTRMLNAENAVEIKKLKNEWDWVRQLIASMYRAEAIAYNSALDFEDGIDEEI